MYNLTSFNPVHLHHREILLSVDDLREALSWVRSDEIFEYYAQERHLPLLFSARKGSETIGCVKYGTRYYILTEGIDSSLLSLVTTAQGIFMNQHAPLIDDLLLIAIQNGEESDLFVDSMLRSIWRDHRGIVVLVPDSFVEARCYDLTFAVGCLREIKSRLC